MPKSYTLLFFLIFIWPPDHFAQNSRLKGLEKSVRIQVDQWGVPHIYAETEQDLFMAQGYYAARDRLFQFEVWRRQATGTVAEWLGHQELQRDIGTRLFMFRGDIEDEMNHYHPRGSLIIRAYVEGVNAYIDEALENPEQLPAEFHLLGIQPQHWTPAVVISRHQGLLGNINDEILTSRQVARLGVEKTIELNHFHPRTPDLTIHPKIKQEWLFHDLIAPYRAFRRGIAYRKEHILSQAQNPEPIIEKYPTEIMPMDRNTIGSNNWIIDGSKTESGYPIMANDPHRRQSAPSLRYMAHLVGPGWNVIGGGEPEIPGISIGHNEYGAWGLTVFSTDAEDLYFYELNPDDPEQYKYQGKWMNFKSIPDTIIVKDMDDHVTIHRYTIHGPVTKINVEEGYACAMRCGWLEIGGSPYLASLRMNQAKDFDGFREACDYSHIPGENMIWADREGHIGWQSVGIAPIRNHTSGMVVTWASDEDQDWEGYLPIIEKPWLEDPEEGFFSTANQHVTPPNYQHWNAIGFEWSDPYRGNRLKEVLSSGRKFTMQDMVSLQTDYYSIPARELTRLFVSIPTDDSIALRTKSLWSNWDYQLEVHSIPAAIYAEWESVLRDQMKSVVLPKSTRFEAVYLSLYKIIQWLQFPDDRFGEEPVAGRNDFLMDCLHKAVANLTERLGEDWSHWQYGQLDNKHVLIRHPLHQVVNKAWQKKLSVGPAPRGGNSFTLNNTSSNLNQTHGASFKIIVDTKDWDQCLATNTPGQSGDPDSPFYKNLFDIWVNNQYFPLFYSPEKVDQVTHHTLALSPE